MLFSVVVSFPCSLKLSNKNPSSAVRSFTCVPGVRDRGAALPADPGLGNQCCSLPCFPELEGE